MKITTPLKLLAALAALSLFPACDGGSSSSSSSSNTQEAFFRDTTLANIADDVLFLEFDEVSDDSGDTVLIPGNSTLTFEDAGSATASNNTWFFNDNVILGVPLLDGNELNFTIIDMQDIDGLHHELRDINFTATSEAGDTVSGDFTAILRVLNADAQFEVYDVTGSFTYTYDTDLGFGGGLAP